MIYVKKENSLIKRLKLNPIVSNQNSIIFIKYKMTDQNNFTKKVPKDFQLKMILFLMLKPIKKFMIC